jgi:hypothetical protein
MSADDDQGVSLVTEVRVRCHSDRLDAALIDGAATSSSPELELRAQRCDGR